MDQTNAATIATNADEPMLDPMLEAFAYDHLPTVQEELGFCFHAYAHSLAEALPANPERTACLRQLLASRDAALRALNPQPPGRCGHI